MKYGTVTAMIIKKMSAFINGKESDDDLTRPISSNFSPVDSNFRFILNVLGKSVLSP